MNLPLCFASGVFGGVAWGDTLLLWTVEFKLVAEVRVGWAFGTGGKLESIVSKSFFSGESSSHVTSKIWKKFN